MTTGKANITLFMSSTWRALWLSYTDPHSTVPLVTLWIMDTKAPCWKVIFIFLFANTKCFCFSHIKWRKIFVWASGDCLLCWIDPSNISISHWKEFMLLCIINITYHSSWAWIESDLAEWMHPFIFIAQKVFSWFFHAVNPRAFYRSPLPNCECSHYY